MKIEWAPISFELLLDVGYADHVSDIADEWDFEALFGRVDLCSLSQVSHDTESGRRWRKRYRNLIGSRNDQNRC